MPRRSRLDLRAEVRDVAARLSRHASQARQMLRKLLDRTLGDIKGYLEWMEKDLTQFDASLPDAAVKRLEARRGKLLKDQNVVSGLGFAPRRRDDAPTTYAVPTVRRKPAIARPPSGKPRPAQPEAALAMEEYESLTLHHSDTPSGRRSDPAPRPAWRRGARYLATRAGLAGQVL